MRLLISALIIANLLLCSGCAVFNRNNTPALNFVEQKMLPRENPGRTLSYPLAIPLGLAAASLDMFLLHPVSVVEDSWSDTKDALWDKFDWDKHYVTTTVSLLPRAAVTPVVFTGDFLARSSFDISRKGGDVRLLKNDDPSRIREQKENREKLLSAARAALENKDSPAALLMAEEILANEPNNKEAAAIKAYVYLELRNLNALAVMPPHLPLFLDNRFCQLFADLLASGSPAERMAALAILERSSFVLRTNRSNKTEFQHNILLALERNLADSDRAILMKTMQVLGKYRHADQSSRQLLEKLAKGDDPVLATAAAALLR